MIIRAESASDVLRNEQLVTLDPHQAIVYKGFL
jgi:phosphohistidine swiveling domain-containing protein